MSTILIIGEDPDAMSADDHPPGVTPASIRAALHGARDTLRSKGHEVAILWTTAADRIASELAAAVKGHSYDVLVIGAGLRVLPPMAAQFENLMNAIREHAPKARLAFNSKPDDTADAAERQVRAS